MSTSRHDKCITNNCVRNYVDETGDHAMDTLLYIKPLIDLEYDGITVEKGQELKAYRTISNHWLVVDSSDHQVGVLETDDLDLFEISVMS